MKDLFTLNSEIEKLQRNLNAMREVLSPSNAAVERLGKRLQELLQEKKVAVAEMAEGIKNLPPTVQEMFKLRYVDGVKWGEIARHLNYSESSIYKMHRQYKSRFFDKQTPAQRKFSTYC